MTVLRKIILPTMLAVLAYGFWLSPDFKAIAAGVAIFLFGMLFLEQGFRAFTGGVLEKLLQRTTDRLWKSLGLGIVATTIMQSSSLVSVVTISFMSAGLLQLAGGIGIIFGANLGTTTGAWLVAGLGLKVDIAAYAMPMLVFGIALVFQRSGAIKGIGYVLAGLGFLFLGIHYMKEGFEAFRTTIDLAQFAMSGYAGLLLFSLVGAVATVIMQSSHATLVLIITALAAGQITYENALALAIGANVGTTVTAVIGAMSANEQGKRLAGAHFVFNVVTGLIAIAFIGQFIWAVDWIGLHTGIRDLDFTLKLAVFHTLFNLVGVVVMVPLIGPMVALLERAFPEKRPAVLGPKFLNAASVDFPETALQAVRNETLHVYDNAVEVIGHGINLHRADIRSEQPLEELVRERTQVFRLDIDEVYERNIKGIYGAIIAFISRAGFSSESEQSGQIFWLRSANRHIVEAIKGIKHLRKNLSRFMLSRNGHIRDEYNRIRVQIATILRELEQIRRGEVDEAPILALDALALTIEQYDEETNKRLVRLIREDRITPAMGTSLMNDSAYTYDVCRNLIEAGRTLFIPKDSEQAAAERSVALGDEELESIRDTRELAKNEAALEE